MHDGTIGTERGNRQRGNRLFLCARGHDASVGATRERARGNRRSGDRGLDLEAAPLNEAGTCHPSMALLAAEQMRAAGHIEQQTRAGIERDQRRETFAPIGDGNEQLPVGALIRLDHRQGRMPRPRIGQRQSGHETDRRRLGIHGHQPQCIFDLVTITSGLSSGAPAFAPLSQIRCLHMRSTERLGSQSARMRRLAEETLITVPLHAPMPDRAAAVTHKICVEDGLPQSSAKDGDEAVANDPARLGRARPDRGGKTQQDIADAGLRGGKRQTAAGDKIDASGIAPELEQHGAKRAAGQALQSRAQAACRIGHTHDHHAAGMQAEIEQVPSSRVRRFRAPQNPGGSREPGGGPPPGWPDRRQNPWPPRCVAPARRRLHAGHRSSTRSAGRHRRPHARARSGHRTGPGLGFEAGNSSPQRGQPVCCVAHPDVSMFLLCSSMISERGISSTTLQAVVPTLKTALHLKSDEFIRPSDRAKCRVIKKTRSEREPNDTPRVAGVFRPVVWLGSVASSGRQIRGVPEGVSNAGRQSASSGSAPKPSRSDPVNHHEIRTIAAGLSRP